MSGGERPPQVLTAAVRRRYLRPGGPWDGPPLTDDFEAAATTTTELVVGPHRLTTAQITQQSRALAGALRDAGLRARSVVAFQLPNSAEAVSLFRACWCCGAVAAPLHHRAGASEVRAALSALRPALVVSAPELPAAGAPGATTVSQLLARSAKPLRAPLGRPASPAVLLQTSGSSGRPKAVLHTQRSLRCTAATLARAHGLTPADTVLLPAPMAHISGLQYGVVTAGVVPHGVVVMNRWDPDEAIELIEREGVTFMVGPPTFFLGILDASGFRPDRVESLRFISCGGAGVSPEFVKRARDGLAVEVRRTYGSTEAPSVATVTDATGTGGACATGEAELMVVDPAAGRPVPPGTPGELMVRAPGLFSGYADPAGTRDAVHRGWYRTADLASLDEHGGLHLLGRLDDVIIRGGENVDPALVERVLQRHPSVRRAAVLGVADPAMGERVAAVVVADESFDLAACRAWFEKAGIARYAWPERVVTVDDLPLLASGKPDRRALRALVR